MKKLLSALFVALLVVSFAASVFATSIEVTANVVGTATITAADSVTFNDYDFLDAAPSLDSIITVQATIDQDWTVSVDAGDELSDGAGHTLDVTAAMASASGNGDGTATATVTVTAGQQSPAGAYTGSLNVTVALN